MTYNRHVLIEILIHHWRTNISACSCGWAELGGSHPGHVADVYEEAVAYHDLEDRWR
jgi:hypothetical protein